MKKKFIKNLSLFLVCIFCVPMFSACSKSFSGKNTYENSAKYSIGNTTFTESVSTIVIDWIYGDVEVKTHSESYFSLVEEVDSSVDDDLRLHWLKSDDTLSVEYSASGVKNDKFNSLSKKFTLLIPETAEIGDLSITGDYVDIEIENISANNLTVKTQAGDIDAEVGEISNTCQLMTSENYEVSLDSDKFIDRVEISSSKIEVDVDSIYSIDIQSLGGEVDIECNEASIILVNNKKSDTEISCKKINEEITVNAGSGKTEIELQKDAKFNAVITKNSKKIGNINVEFDATIDGLNYTVGSSNVAINIKTSGDVDILKIEED